MVKRLEYDANIAIEWFESNYMKLNQDKCHLIILDHKFEAVWAKIGETQVCGSSKEMLLGVAIENDLNFDKFVIKLYKKQEFLKFLKFDSNKNLNVNFINFQFVCCPLAWTICGRKANSRINHLHGRVL